MPEAETEAPFTLERLEDNVWMQHPQWGWMKVGPFEAVCDELYRFLEKEDCRE